MKKIMFDDRFGLTQAVLDGRKTMTRRVIPAKAIEYILGEFKQEYFEATLDVFDSDKKYIEQYYLVEKCGKCFRPGDIVAVAQSYRDIYDLLPDDLGPLRVSNGYLHESCGWTNKMFVLPHVMPHQIRITNVRVERLQDISDEDCLREGIVKALGLYGCEGVCERGDQIFFCNPREAFASLITKMAGKKAWDDNPWVFVYEFELIK